MRKLIICIFIFISIITLITDKYIKKYVSAEDHLIKDGKIKLDYKSWNNFSKDYFRIFFDENLLKLESDNPLNSVGVYKEFKRKQFNNYINIQAVVKTSGVVVGKKGWNEARLLFFQYNKKRVRLKTDHVLASLDGSTEFKLYKKVFNILPETKYLKLVLILSNCTGTMIVKNIELYPVVKNDIYPYFQSLILFVWFCYFSFILFNFFKFHKSLWVLRALLLTAVLLIIAGTSLPGHYKKNILNFISAETINLSSAVCVKPLIKINDFKSLVGWDITKAGHFGLFFLFGVFLVFLINPSTIFHFDYFYIPIIGASTEFIQLFINGRSCLAGDLCIDLAGGFIGIIFAFLVRKIPISFQNKFKNENYIIL